MFSALKFVAASVIVALFGAFLLSGILPSDRADEVAPGAETTEPTTELVTGQVDTDGTDRPAFETRMVITLLDASNPDDDPVQLGEFVLEAAERLDAHTFAIEYDPERIDQDGTYVLDMRNEQSASGQIIHVAEEQVPVITQGHPTEDVESCSWTSMIRGRSGRSRASSWRTRASPIQTHQRASWSPWSRTPVTATEMAPLGEWIAENITRLRPPRPSRWATTPRSIDPNGNVPHAGSSRGRRDWVTDRQRKRRYR